jgi:hypothetical protein
MKKVLSVTLAMFWMIGLAQAQHTVNDSKNISDGAAKGQASELKAPKHKKPPKPPKQANKTTTRSNTQHN